VKKHNFKSINIWIEILAIIISIALVVLKAINIEFDIAPIISIIAGLLSLLMILGIIDKSDSVNESNVEENLIGAVSDLKNFDEKIKKEGDSMKKNQCSKKCKGTSKKK
jgi:uncharacterized membrane protein